MDLFEKCRNYTEARAAQAAGLSYGQLISLLVNLAARRHERCASGYG